MTHGEYYFQKYGVTPERCQELYDIFSKGTIKLDVFDKEKSIKIFCDACNIVKDNEILMINEIFENVFNLTQKMTDFLIPSLN